MASAAWERRNAKARAAGYKSYYDYRAHDYGRQPPTAPRARGAQLARLRGHRGAGELERVLRSGRVELVSVVTTVDARGRVGVDTLVTMDDGRTVEYRVPERDCGRIGATLDDMGADAPQLVGSPRTLTRFVDVDDTEFDDDDLADEFDEGLAR